MCIVFTIPSIISKVAYLPTKAVFGFSAMCVSWNVRFLPNNYSLHQIIFRVYAGKKSVTKYSTNDLPDLHKTNTAVNLKSIWQDFSPKYSHSPLEIMRGIGWFGFEGLGFFEKKRSSGQTQSRREVALNSKLSNCCETQLLITNRELYSRKVAEMSNICRLLDSRPYSYTLAWEDFKLEIIYNYQLHVWNMRAF